MQGCNGTEQCTGPSLKSGPREANSETRTRTCGSLPVCPQNEHMWGAMAWHWAEGEAELCCSHYKGLTLSQGVSEAGMAPQSCLTLRQGASVHNPHHCLHDSGRDPGLSISLLLKGILREGGSWRCKFLERPLSSASVLKRASGDTAASQPMLCPWIHVLRTIRPGNSSSRILVGHFAWGNLQEKGNRDDSSLTMQLT